jgi:hypothetical protein
MHHKHRCHLTMTGSFTFFVLTPIFDSFWTWVGDFLNTWDGH